MKKAAPKAPYIEVFEGEYHGAKGLYYFHVRAAGNNKIIAQSEGYKRKADAKKTAKLFGMEVREV